MNQEQIIQMQIIKQEANQLNEYLKLIEQNTSELEELNLSLDEIEKTENKNILANIGKRIYLPVEIGDKNKRLIVEVGKGNFVKKSIPETKEVVNEQIKKLSESKMQVMGKLEDLQNEIDNLMMQIEKESEKDSGKKRKK